jgi:integrase/recombinase XerD
MNTLSQALREYLSMRRSLGFRLRRVAPRLLDFVTFIEQQHASYITVPLALAWAKQPADAQLATWAQHLSFVRSFARYRRATDPRTEIPPEERAQWDALGKDLGRRLQCSAGENLIQPRSCGSSSDLT